MGAAQSIGVVVDTRRGTSVARGIQADLRSVFGTRIELNTHYLAELSGDYLIDDEVVLTMLPNRAVKVAPYVSKQDRILVIERTIREKNIYQILEIPEKTRVLVVNDNTDTTLQTISLLYQIGVDHLDLIPFDPDDYDPAIQIAITPNEARLVPPEVKKIINIGDRCIDAYTFLRIIHRLGVDDKQTTERLLGYLGEIASLNTGVKRQYRDFHIINERLKSVLALSGEAIAIINLENRIIYCNAKFNEFFADSAIRTDAAIGDYLSEELYGLLCGNSHLDQRLFDGPERSFIVSKSPLTYFGEINGYYLNFREVTYIRQLEQNLSKQLKQKGLVARYRFEKIIFASAQMKKCIAHAKKIADSDLTVLIMGASGTGKELMGQSIHNYSHRRNHPFVAINCAALPETLLESELFGYEGGAFTGARKKGKLGLIEQAHHGTLFLDEIGDMPLYLQARLLRVIQERQLMRLGSDRVIGVNIRIIAATNKDLLDLCERGLFRPDLYHRLNVLSLPIPPLSQRRDDILPLFSHFMGRDAAPLPPEVRTRLLSYHWPGNVRELANCAHHYRLMGELKEEIARPAAAPQQERGPMAELPPSLLQRADPELLAAVLNVMGRERPDGVGRGYLGRSLARQGFQVGEGRLKGILAALAGEGLIISGKGRGGSRLSEGGRRLMGRLGSAV